MTYPSQRVIQTGYDAAGRLAGVKDQASGTYYAGGAYDDDTNRVKYAAHGAASVMKLGNGLWEHTTYNNRLQSTEIGLGTSSTDSSTVGLSYTYGTTNNNANVLTQSYAGGGLNYTQTYTYDEVNRLSTSSEGGSSWSQSNLYDRYGNRWVSGGLSFSTSTNRITTSGYSYDNAGNLTNDSTQSFGFDAENKITKVNGESDVHRYDGDGNRVRKNFTSGEKVRMVYSGEKLIAEYDLSNGSLKKEYVYGAKGLIATIEPTSIIKYTTADHLGTPRVVTNSSAGVVSRHDYKPFGEAVGSGTGGRTTGMGFSGADGVRKKFTSYERDNETGLDYAQARHFGSIAGRFISPDPLLASADAGIPQSWNRYAYVMNDPVNFIDPSGLSTCSAEFSYSDCGGDEGFWNGKGGFGDGVAEYKRDYGGMPSAACLPTSLTHYAYMVSVLQTRWAALVF